MVNTMKDEKTKFVSLYSQFYEKFFSGTADAVELLADLQRDYSEEYNLIKNFNKDVDAMEEFIDNLQIQEFVDRNTRLVEERGLMRQSPESSPKLILSRRFPGPSQERDKF